MARRMIRTISLLLSALLLFALAGFAEEAVLPPDPEAELTLEPGEVDPMPDEIDGTGDIPDAGFPSAWEDTSEANGVPPLSGGAAPEANASNAADPSELKIGLKDKYTLSTGYLGKGLTFSSSRPSRASVNKKGVITATKKGRPLN